MGLHPEILEQAVRMTIVGSVTSFILLLVLAFFIVVLGHLFGPNEASQHEDESVVGRGPREVTREKAMAAVAAVAIHKSRILN